MLCRSRNLLDAGLLLPGVECLSPCCSIRISGQQMTTWVEVAMDESVSGKEVLSLLRRFKSLHLAFSPSCRSV
jgi:hypothetical protein